MNQPLYPPARIAWTVWALGAALYLIGFFQRVAPGVMTGELMKDFALSGAALGNLSALYFYSYVAMQIPTGLLADSLGPRRLLSGGALVAALGGLLFALGDSFLLASLGRLLIGGSVAVAFVGMMKLSSHWMPPKHFALASGMALFIGILGALGAGVPLRLGIDLWGWRPLMTAVALASLLVALLIRLKVKDDPEQCGYRSYARDDEQQIRFGVLEGLRRVFAYRNSWLLFLIPGAPGGSALVFAGLWGVPFLTSHYGMTQPQAASQTSVLLIAWALGGPAFGALSDRIGARKPLYLAGCAGLALCWSLIIWIPALPLPLLTTLLALAGFCSGSMIIGFAFAKESVPSPLAGTAAGICNMGSMLGPMLLQPAVGWILDRRWGGETLGEGRLYDLTSYQIAFSLMILWSLLACAALCLTKETGCRALEEKES